MNKETLKLTVLVYKQCCHPVLYTEHVQNMFCICRTITEPYRTITDHLYALQMVLYIQNHYRTIGWQLCISSSEILLLCQ